MKKLIASILTLALLVGIVPAVLGAESAQPGSIKVLSIGEEFSRSGLDYLYKVLEAEGYSDISVAYLTGYKNSSGTVQLGLGSITNYADGLTKGATYSFCNNERDFADDISSSYTVEMALQARDWDYIVLNTTPIQSGRFADFSSALDTMITYIKQYRPNAKIGWHLNWAYQANYTAPGDTDYEKEESKQFNSFFRYRGNPDTMYAAITAAAKQVEPKVDFIMPVGTAVMNMKNSYLNDVQVDAGEYFVDGSNLSELGKLVASYTWYAKLSGKTLEDLNFTDAFLVNLSSADRKVVVEAVNNAIKTPYAVTESSYDEAPTQYEAVVNGTATRHLEGETVAISTKASLNGGRKFLYWQAVDSSVTFADATARTTTFTMPARDVEVKAVYAAQEEVSGQLKVGFGRVDITPDYQNYGVPMQGYGNESTRLATELNSAEDHLMVTAVAVSDGTNTNVITTMDLIYAPKGLIDEAREKVVEEGLLKDGRNLLYSATHTHSGPVVGTAAEKYPFYEEYKAFWMAGMLEAVETALNDLKPVSETKISITEVPGMNFNRHFRNSLGTVSSPGREYYAAERGMFRDCDKDMQLIRFVRDNAVDVLLVNWQGHATRNSLSGTTTKLSADYPGALRRYVEKADEDCLVAFFLGASGNINPHPSVLKDVCARWRVGNTSIGTSLVLSGEALGERMGKYVIEMMENMTTVETGAVQSMHQDATTFNKNTNGFRALKQEAVSIGSSIAFVTAPYEMFDRNAVDVKDASPFDITFVLTCAESQIGYIPEWQTFFYPKLGEPTAYEASVCNAPPGTGEDLADGLIAMLNILYAK